MISQRLRKNTKPSSSRWLLNHINDPYVNARIKDGYRSRSAYKLIEINQKYRIISSGSLVADLGASPGGWSQCAAKAVGEHGKIWAIDLLPMEAIDGVTFLQGDFSLLKTEIPDKKLNAVISDMAPNFTGDSSTEHLRSMNLCTEVLGFAVEKLRSGGSLAMKIIVGGEEKELFKAISRHFSNTYYFKPQSSSKSSAEIYIVAKGKKNSVISE